MVAGAISWFMRSRFVCFSFTAAVFLASCATRSRPTATPEPTHAMHPIDENGPHARKQAVSSEVVDRNKRVVRTLYEECLSRGRLELLPELIAQDYEGILKARGPDGFRTIIEGLRSGFPDIRYTIEDLLADGDRVVIRWTWEGTHDGKYLVFPPSGKRHSVSGITIYEVKEGKIVRAWLQADRLGHLQQLGVVPADIATRPPPRGE
jgi:steroid delta-isomerase-like uncharacterized protein